MIEETRILLNLWRPGMSSVDLQAVALASGHFPNLSARRLRNFIIEGFAPCYLRDDSGVAMYLQKLQPVLTKQEFDQLLFIYTCRVHPVLADFVREVYWQAYVSGQECIRNDEARDFVLCANQNGKTTSFWSASTILRVARYLTSYCADFGLLERGTKRTRKILPFHIESQVATILAHDLHFAGHADNRLLNHPDWALFGLESTDVQNLLKRLALRGHFIVQAAAGVTRISWKYKCMEELVNVLAQK
jgi:hypothetical protein